MSVKYNFAGCHGCIFAEKTNENNPFIRIYRHCQRAAVCKHLHIFGRRPVLGQPSAQFIGAAREYFKTVSPGNFFRLFSPINQVLGLLALIFFWKSSPGIRLGLGAAFVLYIIADVFTFAYFYPRNDIMFKTAQLSDVNLLKKTVTEWSNMNWLRTAIIFAGLCCSCVSLHKIYLLAQK
jgi:uncharacterized membrane protein